MRVQLKKYDYGLSSLISISKVLGPEGFAAVISIPIAYFEFADVVNSSHAVGIVLNCVHSFVNIVLVLPTGIVAA